MIPIDFEVEHKPRAKIGPVDYSSRFPNGSAMPVSGYDSIFTVAKTRLIRSALGYYRKNSAVGPVIIAHQKQLIKPHALCKIPSYKLPAEGVVSCENELTNRKRTRGILRLSTKLDEKLVGAIINLKSSCKNSNHVIEKTMLRSLRKLEVAMK